MSVVPVLISGLASACAAVLLARILRLPWWANLLAAVVAWFVLALELVLWDSPEGSDAWVAAKLSFAPALLGGLYAVVTRGVIGSPEGPLPRSH